MPDVARALVHHVALTVTDLEASVRWYEAVFSIAHRMDVPHAGGVGKVLADGGDPIKDAWVTLPEHGRYASTDAEGKFLT